MSDDFLTNQPLTYSVPEAGKRAGLGRNAAYAAARRGEIPIIRFGSKLRVPAAKWDRLLAEGQPAHSKRVNGDQLEAREE
ncbi:DNA-binding protein [Bradyrhizobium liaoningense]|uniref:DNA-binding protein n=1 Tax=Bradyrhizobium liaoningense TaxID=43992 RepID=UPI001BAD542C|nr:DNA-binding protein [Bradyrhizobium liaoningense]MBR0946842.1 DNA-binding protein [Bradyrhizobium liaoningense]